MRMLYFLMLCTLVLFHFCTSDSAPEFRLIEVARSDRLWTGLAVSKENRLFVNFPRWSPSKAPSVAEIAGKDSTIAYPDKNWNAWEPGDSVAQAFVCVQSVFIDNTDRLWILDTGLDITRGLLPGATRLCRVDLKSNRVMETFVFDSVTLFPDSYLNDVRIDLFKNHAYITDSGNGALVVLNLQTGNARRLLDDHYSTTAESIVISIEGKPWLAPDGRAPRIHSDGIALTPDGQYLYFQSLTGRNLYRIATKWLIADTISQQELGDKVEHVIQSGPADGLIFDQQGRLYISAISANSIDRLDRGGTIERLVSDNRLKWPDSFAISKDGNLYVTTSQIHLQGRQTEPFYIFRMGIR